MDCECEKKLNFFQGLYFQYQMPIVVSQQMRKEVCACLQIQAICLSASQTAADTGRVSIRSGLCPVEIAKQVTFAFVQEHNATVEKGSGSSK